MILCQRATRATCIYACSRIGSPLWSIGEIEFASKRESTSGMRFGGAWRGSCVHVGWMHEQIESVQREISMMTGLRHQHIVNFLDSSQYAAYLCAITSGRGHAMVDALLAVCVAATIERTPI